MATQDYDGRNSIDPQQPNQESQPLLDHPHDIEDDDEFPHPRDEAALPFSQRLELAFSRLAHPNRLSTLERILIVATFIFLLLAALFIGLFAGAQHRLSHRPIPIPPNEPGGGGTIPGDGDGGDGDTYLPCLTEECVFAAGDVLRSIDDTVEPCQDFYHFAAGGWLKSHPIPADAGLFGIGQYLAKRNAEMVDDILTGVKTPISDDPAQRSADKDNIRKLRDFYNACMDTDAQDKVGDGPLLDVIQELRSRLYGKSKLEDDGGGQSDEVRFVDQAGGPKRPPTSEEPVPPKLPPGRAPISHPPTDQGRPRPPSSGRQKHLTSTLAWAHSRGIPAFFSWMVDGNAKVDPTFGTPALLPDGLGFPDRAYYTDEDELEFYGKVVFDGLKSLEDADAVRHKIALTSGAKKGKNPAPRKPRTEKEIREISDAVIDFERQIARITPTGVELANPLGIYNPTNLSALSYAFTSIDWPSYLTALTVRIPHTIIVQSPSFVKSLDTLISRTSTETIEAYLSWTAIRVLGLNLGPKVPLRNAADSLDRRSKGVDQDADEDRQPVCQASLNAALGYMSGRFFVREAFPPSSKARTSEIISTIIDAFKERLPELAWLDPTTRRKAEKKADAVRIKVGYPESPNTTDARSVQSFYSDLEVHKTDFFGNSLRSMARGSRRDWSYVGRTLDAKRFDMFPAEVNAYYNPGANEIVFPAGIMQNPYFDPTWPSYMQYGAYGSVVGHELSHAFDPDGRLFDEKGFLHDWWTNDTAIEFNRRRDCLIDQYSKYTIPDGKGGKLHLNAKLTIGEDVADAGGVAQSFAAWKKSTAENPGLNFKLPGLKYTPEQLFFIAYGISWSRNIRTQEAIRRLRTDPHSATSYRVTGVVANNEDFIRAFGCQKGVDPMAKSDEERCEIW